LKSRVHENNWKAKNIEHSKRGIGNKLSEICPENLKDLITKMKTKAADFRGNFMLNLKLFSVFSSDISFIKIC